MRHKKFLDENGQFYGQNTPTISEADTKMKCYEYVVSFLFFVSYLKKQRASQEILDPVLFVFFVSSILCRYPWTRVFQDHQPEPVCATARRSLPQCNRRDRLLGNLNKMETLSDWNQVLSQFPFRGFSLGLERGGGGGRTGRKGKQGGWLKR